MSRMFSGKKIGDPPPPYPLNGKSFCQKNLSGKWVYTLSPLTESPLSFSGKFFPKRAKNDVFFIK